MACPLTATKSAPFLGIWACVCRQISPVWSATSFFGPRSMGCRPPMDCMVLLASGSSSRCFVEPVHLKTFPQRHTRPVQHYPTIAISDRQDRANLLARHVVHFTHRENISDFLLQPRKAI